MHSSDSLKWPFALGVGLAFAVEATGAPPTIPDTVRFLEQATWGPDDSSVQSVQSSGFKAYLKDQFGAPASHYPYNPGVPLRRVDVCPDGSPSTCSRDNFTQYPNQLAFFKAALTGQDQLRQRVAFALHEILVTSGVKLNQPGFMSPYLNLLVDDAFGNYRQLLQDITLNPAMGKYLDMVNNRKPSTDGKVTPNENYGREVLQLFSIGVNWLNADGSVKVDSSGNPIPTYDQETVEGFAYVFTGWTYADPGTQVASRFPNVPNFGNPMVLYRDGTGQDIQHAKGPKDLLALTPGGQPVSLPPNQDGTTDLNAALDNIFNHPNVGPFLGKQLIQHLVTSNPSSDYVSRVTSAFNTGYSGPDKAFGSGQRGDLKAVVAAILLDPEARGSTATKPEFGHLREPVQYVLNVIRALKAPSDGVLMGPVKAMGQNLFYPPSVFSYYPHEFTIPDTSLQGPEFGLNDSNVAISRENFANTITFGNIGATAAGAGTKADLTALATLAANPPDLLDKLDGLFLHGTLTADMRKSILDAVNAVSAKRPLLRAQTALYLVLATGLYQVQR